VARVDFKMPDIGEGVTEGEVVEWFVRVGDEVVEDHPMVEVMTDKATVTIGAPCDARVDALHVDVGHVAKVGEVLLTLESKARASAPAAAAVGTLKDELAGAELFSELGSSGEQNGNGHGPAARPLSSSRVSVRPAIAAERRALRTSAEAVGEISYFKAKPLATPATRRLARDMGVDLRRVVPSGGGRVTNEDVRAAVRADMTDDRPHPPLEEREPIVGIRRKIAERMAHAKATAAHFTFVEECDVSRLVDLRERLGPEAKRRRVRLTYLPFIVKAVTEALKRHPKLNSAVDEQTHELVYKKYYNIGVATATDAGLVVPVVHQADGLRLFEIAERIERLARAAKNGALEPSDLRNSTFTITSLGKQSGLLATPILNHPEVGILGVHRIKDRPVVRDGEIVVGKVMMLSLSFDHRIVDGHVGAGFAYDVIDTLENPERLFFEYL
jgi:pyruvate dehydrogenase E2 component (dihydrolipoamide acetyltransferase)